MTTLAAICFCWLFVAQLLRCVGVCSTLRWRLRDPVAAAVAVLTSDLFCGTRVVGVRCSSFDGAEKIGAPFVVAGSVRRSPSTNAHGLTAPPVPSGSYTIFRRAVLFFFVLIAHGTRWRPCLINERTTRWSGGRRGGSSPSVRVLVL